MHRHPRSSLVLITALALVTLVVLTAAHPTLTSSTWSHGDELALVVAWLVAVATATWLFAVTGACLGALILARPTLARRFAPALPLGLRRLVEIAIVTSCIALPALPASAAPFPPTIRAVAADQPVVRAPAPAPRVSVTTVPASPLTIPLTPVTPVTPVTPSPVVIAPTVPTVPNAAVPSPAATSPHPAPMPRPSEPGSSPAPHVVVHPGDNLWVIARAALAQGGAHRPSEHEVARYWRAVIVANRSTLRSGNPSLIYPGEIVALPPIGAVS